MGHRTPYALMDVKQVEVARLVQGRAGQVRTVGVDIGKYEWAACLLWPDHQFPRPWRVRCPEQLPELLEKLEALAREGPLVVALESSGTYGDILRQALSDRGMVPQRVAAKAVADYAETFDGVPSQHDGKDAAVIAALACQGKAKPWPWQERREADQALRYWVRRLDAAQRIKQIWAGKREGLLARHWPEVTRLLKGSGATLLEALAHWGEPRALAVDPQAPTKLARWGGHFLKPEKIAAVVAAARATVGVRMTPWAVRELRQVAKRILARRQEIARCKRKLRQLTKDHPVIRAQTPAVGLMTACVLWVCLGDVRNYPSAGAYRKAMGLNLRERSSGIWKGQLKLSKRGQRLPRKWLYFSALRWLQDPAVHAWVRRKKARDGGKGSKAVVGVMRRLALAAWQVGKHGVAFDPAKLFPGPTHRRARAIVAPQEVPA